MGAGGVRQEHHSWKMSSVIRKRTATGAAATIRAKAGIDAPSRAAAPDISMRSRAFGAAFCRRDWICRLLATPRTRVARGILRTGSIQQESAARATATSQRALPAGPTAQVCQSSNTGLAVGAVAA